PLITEATEGAFIDSYNNNLIYRNGYKVVTMDAAGNQLREVNIFMYNNAEIRRGFVDAGGNFWVADFKNGLVWQKWDNSLQTIYPNGPRSESVWAMAGSNGRLWVASGAL